MIVSGGRQIGHVAPRGISSRSTRLAFQPSINSSLALNCSRTHLTSTIMFIPAREYIPAILRLRSDTKTTDTEDVRCTRLWHLPEPTDTICREMLEEDEVETWMFVPSHGVTAHTIWRITVMDRAHMTHSELRDQRFQDIEMVQDRLSRVVDSTEEHLAEIRRLLGVYRNIAFSHGPLHGRPVCIRRQNLVVVIGEAVRATIHITMSND